MPYRSGYPDTVTHPPTDPFERNRLFRPLLALVFLISVQVVFTFWSQVGGQTHLELMFWPWKFGLSLLAACFITAIAAGARRVRTVWILLIGTAIIAGLVTYYYHINEPADEEQDSAQSYQT